MVKSFEKASKKHPKKRHETPSLLHLRGEGLQSAEPDVSLALGSSSKGLESQKRKLQQLVKRLKTQVGASEALKRLLRGF